MNKYELFQKFSVLYIEDDQKERQEIKETLEKFFKKVYVCDTIQEAYAIYSTKKLDIVFVDITLPDGNGLEWIQEKRKKDTNTFFVVITSSSSINDLMCAIPLKLEDYIIKPVTFKKLISCFDKIVENFHRTKPTVEFENYRYDYTLQAFVNSDETINLSTHQAQLFELLLQYANTIVSYEMIEYEMCQNKPVNMGTIRNHIQKFRSILGADRIVGIVNKGYKLTI